MLAVSLPAAVFEVKGIVDYNGFISNEDIFNCCMDNKGHAIPGT